MPESLEPNTAGTPEEIIESGPGVQDSILYKPPPPQTTMVPPPPLCPSFVASRPMEVLRTRPIGGGNHDKAWNDPPQFSVDVNTRPSGPRRTKLTGRVAFPLSGTGTPQQPGIITGSTAPPTLYTPPIPAEIMPSLPSMGSSRSNVITGIIPSTNPSDNTWADSDQL